MPCGHPSRNFSVVIVVRFEFVFRTRNLHRRLKQALLGAFPDFTGPARFTGPADSGPAKLHPGAWSINFVRELQRWSLGDEVGSFQPWWIHTSLLSWGGGCILQVRPYPLSAPFLSILWAAPHPPWLGLTVVLLFILTKWGGLWRGLEGK